MKFDILDRSIYSIEYNFCDKPYWGWDKCDILLNPPSVDVTTLGDRREGDDKSFIFDLEESLVSLFIDNFDCFSLGMPIG